MPYVDTKQAIGRFDVGIRRERTFSLRQLVDDFDADPLAWELDESAEGSTLAVSRHVGESASHGLLEWRIRKGASRAEVSRPLQPDGAGGIALNMRTSAPLGDVRIGVLEADGSRYEWELALPCVAEPIDPSRIDRALWVRARAAFDCMTPADDSEDENEQLDADQIDRLWLRGPEKVPRDLLIEMDDVALMDVAVKGEPPAGEQEAQQ